MLVVASEWNQKNADSEVCVIKNEAGEIGLILIAMRDRDVLCMHGNLICAWVE